jgi:nucleoside-diphosphate kinase
MKLEKTLVIIKPDAMQRSLLGNIVTRFENKGLKVVGMKMMQLEDVLLDEHYSHHKDKPFFGSIKNYMKSSPVMVIALEGIEAIDSVRLLVGSTQGRTADVGTIRGDLGMSMETNLIHSSDSAEAAEDEVKRFFKDDEVFNYKKVDFEFIYGGEEREGLE